MRLCCQQKSELYVILVVEYLKVSTKEIVLTILEISHAGDKPIGNDIMLFVASQYDMTLQ